MNLYRDDVCRIEACQLTVRSPPMTDLRTALHSALAFPITPFTAEGDVDLDAVATNASFLPGTGIGAIVAPSGTGEFFALTTDEAKDIVAATVSVAGELPVIAAAGFGP